MKKVIDNLHTSQVKWDISQIFSEIREILLEKDNMELYQILTYEMNYNSKLAKNWLGFLVIRHQYNIIKEFKCCIICLF